MMHTFFSNARRPTKEHRNSAKNQPPAAHCGRRLKQVNNPSRLRRHCQRERALTFKRQVASLGD